jgi:hypothetical protein
MCIIEYKSSLNLPVRIKFLNLFYIYLNKNWKVYWSEQSFTCLRLEDEYSPCELIIQFSYKY